MNVYQKLAEARQKLKAAGLKQSGKNKGVGYTYFDLQDILPQTTSIEKELGLLSVVSFSETEGTLSVINTEKPEEQIIFKSPVREAELRGCHPVQNLGAIETYVRRYLYLLAYEIVETEAIDLSSDEDNKTPKKPTVKPANATNDKTPSKRNKTPQSANNEAKKGPEQPTATLKEEILDERANARNTEVTIKGTLYRLGDLTVAQLDWLIARAKGDVLVAAQMVKKQKLKAAIDSDKELPFN